MSHYQEMTPIVIDHSVWNDGVTQYNGWQVSMRHCPECHYLMGTNHKGDFACNRCGYTDHQDVSHLAGLNWRNERYYANSKMRYGRRRV